MVNIAEDQDFIAMLEKQISAHNIIEKAEK